MNGKTTHALTSPRLKTSEFYAQSYNQETKKGKIAMTDDMSTPYLLTLMEDRIEDLQRMIDKLKTQDKEHTVWCDQGVNTLKQSLIWLKAKAEERRNEVLKYKGKDPVLYAM